MVDDVVINKAAIDLAMHLGTACRLRVLQESREAFDLLFAGAGLDAGHGERLAGAPPSG